MMRNLNMAVITSPIGKLQIQTTETQLTHIQFVTNTTKLITPQTHLMREIEDQLQAYFKDPTFSFSISLKIQGTPFQMRTWQTLQQIPAGKTRTYGELASRLHSSPRAIGNACRQNPIPILIPCHRITSKSGLGGFCGQTVGPSLKIKQWLLNHERN